jgi:putative ABC transport system substrate-binding protein
MKNKVITLTLCALLYALSYSASAQQPGKVAHIGFLDTSTASGSAVVVDAFRLELNKLGWIEGKSIARVGLLFTAGGQVAQRKELRPAARALKVKLEEIETRVDAKSLERAFQTARQKQVGGIMTTAIRLFFAERKRIVELAVKYRLPAIYFQKEFVDEGGLMSYGADLTDLYRRAAVYVDKILRGAKPADLPVQQATKFEFVINLKAAKQIDLTVPPDVLARTNQVIR